MSFIANAVYNESLTITGIGKVDDSEKIDYELKSEVCLDARDRFSYRQYPSDFRCSNWQQNSSSPLTSPGDGRPVQPRPKRWNARTSGGPPAQPRAYAVAGSHRRRASSAAAAYAVGRPDQLRVSQISRGSTRWRARNQQPSGSSPPRIS
jgi:hypothetical protein